MITAQLSLLISRQAIQAVVGVKIADGWVDQVVLVENIAIAVVAVLDAVFGTCRALENFFFEFVLHSSSRHLYFVRREALTSRFHSPLLINYTCRC